MVRKEIPDPGVTGSALEHLPHEEIIECYEGGETVASIADHLHDRGLQVSAHSVDEVLAMYEIPPHALSDGRNGVARSRRIAKADSAKSLARIAGRHKAGRGVPIGELAEQARVDVEVLTRALQAAGHVVSTRAEWTSRRLAELTDDIVRKFREERRPPAEIRTWLRQHDLRLTVRQVQHVLHEAGALDVKIPQRRPLPRKVSPLPGSTWEAIAGHEAELARRILEDGESIKKVAAEFEVDPALLSIELKRSGHLPGVSLNRLRTWRRKEAGR